VWHDPTIEVPGCVTQHWHHDNQTEEKRYGSDDEAAGDN
jgi:hypothetical protein